MRYLSRLSSKCCPGSLLPNRCCGSQDAGYIIRCVLMLWAHQAECDWQVGVGLRTDYLQPSRPLAT